MNPLDKLNEFIQKALRVLRVSYRPTSDEFYTTLKITGLGMVLIGVIGYVLTIIFGFLEKGGKS
ncbi:protein translocase SEC61 complex subunit gamma [Candidatus Micrarchaeota archaeon]|nr:protein translocase SEC61 complex subunit gamma [Candidatus Micrarchaeota archaeon]